MIFSPFCWEKSNQVKLIKSLTFTELNKKTVSMVDANIQVQVEAETKFKEAVNQFKNHRKCNETFKKLNCQSTTQIKRAKA